MSKFKSILRKNRVFVVFMAMVMHLSFSMNALAETIDGSGEFDNLLISITDLLNSSILTFVLIASIICYGCSLALFQQGHETVQKGVRIVLGLIIAAKGAGFVASSLGLSFLI